VDKTPLSQEEIDALLAAASEAEDEEQEETGHDSVTHDSERVIASRVEFESMEPTKSASEQLDVQGNVSLILDVPMEVTVELGRTRRLIKEILTMTPGTVVELDRQAGEPVDILVNGRLLARGEVVVIDENFGVRISEIVSRAERLASLR